MTTNNQIALPVLGANPATALVAATGRLTINEVEKFAENRAGPRVPDQAMAALDTKKGDEAAALVVASVINLDGEVNEIGTHVNRVGKHADEAHEIASDAQETAQNLDGYANTLRAMISNMTVTVNELKDEQRVIIAILRMVCSKIGINYDAVS